MSFWERLFKPKGTTAKPSQSDIVERVGLLLLAAREKRDDSLRHSVLLADLLRLLWNEDAASHEVVYRAFSTVEKIDRAYILTLGQRLRTASAEVPFPPEERYASVVERLREDLVTGRPYPLPFGQRIITRETGERLLYAVMLARILLASELHELICETLVANNRALEGRLDDEASIPYQYLLRDQIHKYLLAFPPSVIPHFWRMVADERTGKEFWPVLGRIRDREAVPYLLELLPTVDYPTDQGYWNVGEARTGAPPSRQIEFGGQWQVIAALREMRDARAVPVLQAMGKRCDYSMYHIVGGAGEFLTNQRDNNELAVQAEKAARHILRNSSDAGAQLLRPSEERKPDSDILLRPANPAAGTTPSGELLRPSEEDGTV